LVTEFHQVEFHAHLLNVWFHPDTLSAPQKPVNLR
jgi:hypothetical protein